MTRSTCTICVFAALALGGCPASRDLPPPPTLVDVAIVDTTKVDLLVVADNSNATLQMQAVMAEQFVILASELIGPTDPATPAVEDLHVGVASIDLGTLGHTIQTCDDPADGDDGELQNEDHGITTGCQPSYSEPGCTFASGCPWLSHSTDHPDDGTDADNRPIWEDYACIGTLGTSGCGFEQPLESMYRALVEQTRPGGANEGFLRDDAVLVVIHLFDEDDCSTDDQSMFDPDDDTLGTLNVRCAMHPERLLPVSRYRDALVELRGDRLIFAVIAGVPVDGRWEVGDPLEALRDLVGMDPENPNELIKSCDTAMGVAFAPVRLVELAYAFGEDGFVASCCRQDWTPALEAIAARVQGKLGTGCVALPAGVADAAADCRLYETSVGGDEVEVPAGGWELAFDGASCAGDGQLRRGGEPLRADGYRLECLVSP